MAITVTCSNGHLLRIKDEHGGKSGLCPHCHVRVVVPASVRTFEDEVLALVGTPRRIQPSRPFEDSIYDEASVLMHNEARESGVDLMGSTLVCHEKMCPQCCELVSSTLAICPHCGTSLAVRGNQCPKPIKTSEMPLSGY